MELAAFCQANPDVDAEHTLDKHTLVETKPELYLTKLTAKISRLEERVTELESGDKHIHPPNFHQLAANFCLNSKLPLGKKLPLLAASALMILAQAVSLITVVLSGAVTPCFENDDCFYGQFCAIDGTRDSHGNIWNPQRCIWCSVGGPGWQDDVYAAEAACNGNNTLELNAELGLGKLSFSAGDQDLFCDKCFNLEGELIILHRAYSAPLQLLNKGDWFVMFVCFTILGWLLAAECRDVRLVELELAQTRPRTSWHFFYQAACCVRLMVVVPMVICAVPVVLTFFGASALNTCFNSIAILFLIDIDNIAYECLVDAESRAEFESSSRLAVTDDQQQRINQSVRVNRTLPVLFMVAQMVLLASMDKFKSWESAPMSLWPLFVYPLTAGLFEACSGASLDTSIPSAMIKVTGESFFGGVIALIVWIIVSVVFQS